MAKCKPRKKNVPENVDRQVFDANEAAYALNTGPNQIRELCRVWEKAKDAGIPDEKITVPYLRCLDRPRPKSPYKVPVSEIGAYNERALARRG